MKLLPLAMSLLLGFAAFSEAAVPQIIQYQGRVSVGSVNFDGNGQFKFALVGANGTPTYWSNDGSSVNGSQPAAAVSLPVVKGLYSVPLGSSSFANMLPVPAAVFSNAAVYLRVWFNDGTNGVQQLSPDQRIASVGYAMMAENVSDGAITSAKIAAGAVGSAQLAPNAAQQNLAAANVAGVAAGGIIMSQSSQNAALVAGGYTNIGSTFMTDLWKGGPQVPALGRVVTFKSVWTGTEVLMWGRHFDLNIGSGGIYNPYTKTSVYISTQGQPSARGGFTAVWSGTEMIVWGGSAWGGSYVNDGGRYNPTTNTWTSISTVGAPAPRARHTAVWSTTTNEMIIWGGQAGISTEGLFGDGAKYNPATNSWTPVSMTNAPSSRHNHTAVWSGTEMIVYGGYNGADSFSHGARYNPVTNVWSAMAGSYSTQEHDALWTGSKMIVWGGNNDAPGSTSKFGSIYTPATNSWEPIETSGAYGGYVDESIVWTGSELLVWGGSVTNSGGRYDPASKSWRAIGATTAPARARHAAIWTGTEMVIIGGDTLNTNNPQIFSDAWHYTPGKEMFLYEKP